MAALQYKLRSLMIAMAVGPPLLALSWWLDLAAVAGGLAVYAILAAIVCR